MDKIVEKYLLGKYVIVRSRDSGVHGGIFLGYRGREVALANARRCWRYNTTGTGSVSNLSAAGLTGQYRVDPVQPFVLIHDVCETNTTTEKARQSIESAEEG